jgi:hypothetical protein
MSNPGTQVSHSHDVPNEGRATAARAHHAGAALDVMTTANCSNVTFDEI